MQKVINKLLLFAACLVFLSSCALFDKETKKETEAPPKKTQKVTVPRTTAPSMETEALPKKTPKAHVPKTTAPADESPAKPKASQPEPLKSLPEPSSENKTQQNYYDLGMKYYSEENYTEAKKAWQMVLKMGKKTKIANKARENIRKTDQILKTLEGLDNK